MASDDELNTSHILCKSDSLVPRRQILISRNRVLRLTVLRTRRGSSHVRVSGPWNVGQPAWATWCLSRPMFKRYIPSAVAPPIQIYCRSRMFLERQETLLDGALESLTLYGMPVNLRASPVECAEHEPRVPSVPPRWSTREFWSWPAATLDNAGPRRKTVDLRLCETCPLQELKACDRRVLVYYRIARMMDLTEEYLTYVHPSGRPVEAGGPKGRGRGLTD